MTFCGNCYRGGYCKRLNYKIVSNAEINNSDFLLDARKAAQSMGLLQDEWVDWTMDTYRNLPGRFLGKSGREIWLPTLELERPNIRTWYRDFCCTKAPSGKTLSVRKPTRKRTRVFLSILRAEIGPNAELWGARPANDNF